MKTLCKKLFAASLFLIVVSLNAQDNRLEKLFNGQKLPFQYEKESLRYLVGYPLANGRAQIVRVSAYHTIGDIPTINISTLVKSSKLKGRELENWVATANQNIKNGKFSVNKDLVFFQIEIPVNASDKSILEVIDLVANEGDKAEAELTQGDNY